MLIYESLLNLYYDKTAKSFLNGEVIGFIDNFVAYCKAVDVVEDTILVETMETVYDPRTGLSKDELKMKLALSDSSLYRFRVKIVHGLNKYISDNICKK